MKDIDSKGKYELEKVHQKTGGHPLALELFEIYGQETHIDWLQFLDDEIILKLFESERELLSELALQKVPIKWQTLAESVYGKELLKDRFNMDC